MQAALKDRVKNDTEKRQQDVEERKRKDREDEKRVKDQIQTAIDKGRQRPLLIESVFTRKHAENLAKIKATRAFVEILKEQNLNPNEYLDDD